jgi:hypothetical protein
MGVRIRMSRNASAYVPFWAAILFWLAVGPVLLAGWLLWAMVKTGAAVAHAIQAHRDSKAVS